MLGDATSSEAAGSLGPDDSCLRCGGEVHAACLDCLVACCALRVELPCVRHIVAPRVGGPRLNGESEQGAGVDFGIVGEDDQPESDEDGGEYESSGEHFARRWSKPCDIVIEIIADITRRTENREGLVHFWDILWVVRQAGLDSAVVLQAMAM